MSSALHSHRLDVVAAHLLAIAPRSVLDLGCGPGELIDRLVPHARIERIVGIDTSSVALRDTGGRFAALHPRVQIRHASYAVADPALQGFDAAALVETIEHVDPGRLGEVEQAVFGCFRPAHVLITTPNRDYNPFHGLKPGAMRHPDHRFEWGRQRFREWARGVARRNDYRVRFVDIGECRGEFGASTQMACFSVRLPRC